MNKQEFIKQLGSLLSSIVKEERDGLLKFYAEMVDDRIEDGMTEKEAVASMEPAADIAARILNERGSAAPPSKRKPWVVAVTSPFWLTGILLLFTLQLTAYLFLGSLMVLLPIFTLGFAAAAVLGVISAPFLLQESTAQAMMNFGGAAVCAGLGLFTFWWAKASLKPFCRAIGWVHAAGKSLYRILTGNQPLLVVPKTAPVPAARHTKALYISMAAGGLSLLLGAGLCFGALSTVNFELADLMANKPLDAYTYTAKAAVNKIYVDAAFTQINALPADGDKVTVDYMQNEDEKYQIAEQEGVLTFQRVAHEKWYRSIFFFNVKTSEQQRVLTVRVPKGYTGSLHIKNGNGTVVVKELAQLGALAIETSFDEVTVQDVSVSGTLDVANSNGGVALRRVDVKDGLVCRTSFGDLSAETVNAGGGAELKNSNGGIALRNVNAKGMLSAKASFDPITANDVRADGGILIENSNGDVILQRVTTTQNFTGKTSFGQINGTGISGNELLLENSNGNIELQNGKAAVLARLNTSFGNIRIHRLESGRVYLDNANGNIEGSVVGIMTDFRIYSRAKNDGENNLTDRAEGKKTLEAVTSFGNIKVTFEQ